MVGQTATRSIHGHEQQQQQQHVRSQRCAVHEEGSHAANPSYRRRQSPSLGWCVNGHACSLSSNVLCTPAVLAVLLLAVLPWACEAALVNPLVPDLMSHPPPYTQVGEAPRPFEGCGSPPVAPRDVNGYSK